MEARRKTIESSISQGSDAHKRVLDFLTAELSLPPACSSVIVRIEINRAIECEVIYFPPELEPESGPCHGILLQGGD